MAYLFFWIVFVAFTTTFAYRYPYPSYLPQHQGQDYDASEYQIDDDESLEQESSIFDENQRIPDDIQIDYQDPAAESRLFSPERAIERIIPFRYYERNTKDEIRVAPTFTNDNNEQRENSSYKNPNELTKKFSSAMSRRGAENLGSALYSLDPKFLSENIFIPQVQEDCEVSGICENSPDYPHEYVEALLAKLPDANIRFNLDMETPETSQTGELESQQTVPLCKPKFRIIYPDKARTTAGKWVFIVNGRTTKVQGFSGTLCLGEGQPCNGKISLPKGYRSKCAQKYIDRSMWALDHTGELALVTAPIASCCICELETNSTANYFKKNHLYRSFP